jgi:two-component system nitrogen regulation response regulator NtrX
VLPSTCILLIDDDETIRELVSAVLGDEGYRVVAVPDTDSGLQALRTSPPKLILLDSLANGRAHSAFVMEYERLPAPHAPIYLFSAATNAEETAGQLGLAGVLTKPFDIESLVELAVTYGCEKHATTPARLGSGAR